MNEYIDKNMTKDIILYKEDKGIIYGYFNQKAFDLALYNRAKESTKNFSILDLSDTGERKRAVEMNDISNQKHTIAFRPVDDGEYLTDGDVMLEIGLSLDHRYFRENIISLMNTMLSCGIKLFSYYSGYYSNKIEDIYVGYTNIGNTIKDGDLLFTIKLASKPIDLEHPTKDIKFSYNMLPKDFIENIPYLGDIAIGQWFVENYSKVKEGDNIVEITELTHFEPRFRTILKSPYTGLLVKGFGRSREKLSKDYTIFTIYTDESKLKDRYFNEIAVTTDDFTKAVTIKGQKCAGDTLGFKVGSLYLNFETVSGKIILLVSFDRKDINLNKKCALHLLLEDNTVITLNAITAPTKFHGSYSILRYQIYQEDFNKLETLDFLKWQITNEDGIIIKVGYNKCCKDNNDKSDITQRLSYEVFKDFIKDFNKLVRENISEENVKEASLEDMKVNGKRSCYVYLMIDTTNNFHKIGISNNPQYREHTLQSDKPTIELLCTKEYPSRAIAEAIESALHKVFASKRIRGEWFNLDASDIEEIKQTLK